MPGWRSTSASASPGAAVMSNHPDAFTVDRQVSSDEALANPELAARANALQAPKEAKRGFSRLLMVGASIAALAGGSYYGWDYWTVGRFNVSTDDAYVQADSVTIAPKVPGYL